MQNPELSPESLVVSLGRPPHELDAPVNPSITMTSTYVGALTPGADERVYARFSNPTWDPFEEALGTLEKASSAALLYASGMAAIAAAFNLVPLGGTIVLPQTAYNGTLSLAQQKEKAGHFSVRIGPIADTDATVAMLDGADVLWIESPTNPMLEVADIAALASAAKERGILTIVDNTFATPLVQQPLTQGADVVVHSVTKFLSGHSDVILGAIVCADPEIRKRLHGERTLQGAIPGPFEAWLALRGLRTLSVRVEKAMATAGELARRLEGHPNLDSVRYPGLPSDPGFERARATMSGFGAVLGIYVKGGAEAAERFLQALQLWTPATSLGGVESLAERRRRHASEPDSVADNMVRLSVGIENVDDLWLDLDQALRASS
ncbi:cystathionine gamma-synthase [Neomicrococcus aestuarii]|uniref:homocysteine desulfhydrase n=1 Tax=Neomicrococcus aestuarii TaxID=556325 RepID=A0A7W8WYI6_9MICC|nr:aminotransferase class I/II-fold pyridoxal phosphate-dependent enzyme [Neomicrococcus aestuarii]MBB5512376.1 cystathionine gamma-synthase [Neomicrococcus aestuarii]